MKNKFLLFKILVSALIIAALLTNMQIADFTRVTLHMSASHILSIIALLLLSLTIRSFRWQVLMNHQTDNRRLSLWGSFRLLLVGTAMNIVMPAGSGDVAKSYVGYKWTGIKERMVAVSLFDKVVSIASVAVLALFSVYHTQNGWFLLAIACSILPLLMLRFHQSVLRFRRLKSWLEKLQTRIRKVDIEELLQHLRFPTTMTVYTITLSVAGWALTYAMLYLCFQMAGLSITLAEVLVMAPVLTLGRLFPFTLNGIGSDEALMVVLFAGPSAAREPLLLAAFLYRGFLMVLPALWGLFYLLSAKSNIFVKHVNVSQQS